MKKLTAAPDSEPVNSVEPLRTEKASVTLDDGRLIVRGLVLPTASWPHSPRRSLLRAATLKASSGRRWKLAQASCSTEARKARWTPWPRKWTVC